MIRFSKYINIWLTVSWQDARYNHSSWNFLIYKRQSFLIFLNLFFVSFQVEYYLLLIVWQSFPSSHFFRFCWKPVPKLIANDQNKGDRQWLGGGWWQELAMKIFTDVTDIWQQRVRRRGEDIHILMNSCPKGPHGQRLIDLYNLVSLQHVGCM